MNLVPIKQHWMKCWLKAGVSSMRKRKNYVQPMPDVPGNVVDMLPIGDVDWRLPVAHRTYDLRRWFFVGRPQLDADGKPITDATSAGRDAMVRTFKEALWRIKAKGATSSTLGNLVTAGAATWFRYQDAM